MNNRVTSVLTLAALLAVSHSATSAATTPPDIPPSEQATVRMMQWNIGGAVPVDGTGRPDEARIAAVIAAESPDIVVLNEVNQDPSDDGPYFGDQPAKLAVLLEDDGYLHSFWGLAEVDLPRGPGSETGNLILSRHPFVGVPEIVKLPNENFEPGGKDRRSMVSISVDVPIIGTIDVHGTHLSTPGSAELVEDQKEQVQVILDSIETTTPTVVAGDFNIRVSDVESQPFSQNNLMQSWIAGAGLVDTWRQVNDGQDGVSMTSAWGSAIGEDPDRRIDYVFASPSFDVLGGHMATDDLFASDHIAVVMDLALSSRDNHTRAVLAGGDELGGWAQLTTADPARAKLSVCKNTGTAIDDGTSVRALLRSDDGQVIQQLTDSGTTRGSCEVSTWSGTIPAEAMLEVQIIDENEVVLHSRQESL